jgi:hypothetical protein
MSFSKAPSYIKLMEKFLHGIPIINKTLFYFSPNSGEPTSTLGGQHV